MKTTVSVATMVGAILLTACASAPTGPSVMALPGTGKTFEQFRYDDYECRQYAQSQTSGSRDSGVRSAALGTAVGAVAGAAIGGHQGAGIGAGTGLIVGSAAGADSSQRESYGTQRQYDNAYVQCMYAKGQKVPAIGVLMQQPAPAANTPPPPPPPSR